MRLRFVCAWILIAVGVSPSALGQEALDAIDGCIKRLDPQTDLGYERIAARCPDLTRRLEGSSWALWLPRDWKAPSNDLSAGSLRELRALVAHELASQRNSRTPDLAALSGVLAALGPLEPQQAGTWARFTRWLREALQRGEPSSSAGWLAGMTVSESLIQLICYSCLAVVVALALAVIVNELRLAGVFAVRKGRSAARVQAPREATSAWSAIQRAPMRERPRLLLELIAARLTELNRLPAAGGLTVRELLQTARLARSEDRSLLADVALAAERVRFAADPLPESALHAAVERGRRLLEHLEA